jgi:site-specific DNA recombinase
MEPAKSRFRRCAIYTRKSSEEGLEQDFNSLHAQREACEAFIKSQVGEGWHLVRTAYDDGGLSGGNMERPALQRLLDDIEKGLVDVVVVYKVDRLTRSLADFAKMVEVFDAHQVSFVAVTQQFNTTTSMGRLTLNVLLSFAQFEREVTGERIRDKIAASKRRGLWMGGVPPLGYDVVGRSLVINPEEAKAVRLIYQGYLELGNVRLLKEHLHHNKIISKVRISKNGARSGGRAFSRGALYELLANPLYVGEVRHRKERHPGQQEAIIGRELWEQVQQRLRDAAVRRGAASRGNVASPLVGRLVDEYGERLTPSHTVKRGRHYRYYVSRRLFRASAAQVKNGRRISALELERSVSAAARSMLNDRAGLIESLPNAEPSADEIRSILRAADAATNSLDSQPQESAVLRDLVDRVELRRDAIQLTLDLLPFAGPDDALEDRGQFKITKLISLQIARRGFEMRLVLGGQTAASPNGDPALLKAVARGFRWFHLIARGEASSAADIARREKLDKQYVSRLIPLAFLAPSIVEAIADGTQPPQLTTEMLTRGVNLPFEWADQHQLLVQSVDVRQFPKPY